MLAFVINSLLISLAFGLVVSIAMNWNQPIRKGGRLLKVTLIAAAAVIATCAAMVLLFFFLVDQQVIYIP